MTPSKLSDKHDPGKPKADGREMSSPQNGRKGGRPPAWSEAVRSTVAACLRKEARHLEPKLHKELLRFAEAIEQGTLRLQHALPSVACKAPQRTIQITVMMRVFGGRSKRGMEKASEEISEQVLRPYSAKMDEGWDYLLIIPYDSDEELDRILSQKIPTAARLIASKRRCSIEYKAYATANPNQRWAAADGDGCK